MDNLQIAGTKRTPEVFFNYSDNSLLIKGRSQPEDVLDFYAPVLAWFDEYMGITKGPVDITLALEYFNTASAKIIFDMLMKIKSYSQNGLIFNVTWKYYDYDEDMRDAAQQLSELTGVKMELITLKE